tara:strand:+ start:121 stop:513 length:393 start_codon:yes stop_codon:yes gene_type:complete
MILLLCSLAFGQIPEYTFVEAGEPAPFSGRLFNDAASQLIADELADCTERCQIEMDYQIGLILSKKQQEMDELKSNHKYETEVLKSKVKTQQERIEDLEKLKTPPKRQFWFITGLVSGIALTISIAKAVE